MKRSRRRAGKQMNSGGRCSAERLPTVAPLAPPCCATSSLIAPSVIMSAAHCFTRRKRRQAVPQRHGGRVGISSQRAARPVLLAVALALPPAFLPAARGIPPTFATPRPPPSRKNKNGAGAHRRVGPHCGHSRLRSATHQTLLVGALRSRAWGVRCRYERGQPGDDCREEAAWDLGAARGAGQASQRGSAAQRGTLLLVFHK